MARAVIASSKFSDPSMFGHEADQHAVAHDLRLEPGRAVDVPEGFPPVPERQADPEPVRRRPGDVRDQAVGPQRLGDPGGFCFLHPGSVRCGS